MSGGAVSVQKGETGITGFYTFRKDTGGERWFSHQGTGPPESSLSVRFCTVSAPFQHRFCSFSAPFLTAGSLLSPQGASFHRREPLLTTGCRESLLTTGCRESCTPTVAGALYTHGSRSLVYTPDAGSLVYTGCREPGTPTRDGSLVHLPVMGAWYTHHGRSLVYTPW